MQGGGGGGAAERQEQRERRLAGAVAAVWGDWVYVRRHGQMDKRMGGQAGLAGRWWWRWYRALGGEGKFDTAGGVALVAGHALQAAVVIQVAGAGCAHTVQLSMGELRAFHVHLNLLCSPGRRGGGRRKGKQTMWLRTEKQILYGSFVAIAFGVVEKKQDTCLKNKAHNIQYFF